MKKILLLSCLLIGFINMISIQAQGICFEKGSFKEVLEKAKKENKCVFIDVYAVWCGPCKLMSNTVFKELEIGNYANEHFVSIKIDCERGEGISIGKNYQVESLPTFLFLDSDGNVVYRTFGAMSSENFMNEMKKAYEYSKDINSVGRLAARYEKEKNDEKFLSLYLEKLRDSRSLGYYDVVESYLDIQTEMQDSSKAMVDFLYDHINALTYGGNADRIIQTNYGTDQWDLYVRKDVRKAFQELKQCMHQQTVEYAIQKKDSILIDLALKRAVENGVQFKSLKEQREQFLAYFYLKTEQGTKYKNLVAPKIDSFYNSLDVEDLRMKHEAMRKYLEEHPKEKGRSYATINSEKLRSQLLDFAKFVSTSQDKMNMLKWAQRVYDLVPEDFNNIMFYAKVLYLYGDKNKGIDLMDKAVQKGKNEKNIESYIKDYEAMKAGKSVSLNIH